MKSRARRLLWIAGGLAALGVASALVLNAFRANVMFFVSPTQVAEERLLPGTRLRVGGLVEQARSRAMRKGSRRTSSSPIPRAISA